RPRIKIFCQIHDLREYLKSLRTSGPLGFVPTMGALHDGHLSLIKQLTTPHIVVSIFVNPLQFNAVEDLNRYPRQLNDDIHKLQKLNLNIVGFAPDSSEMQKASTGTFVSHPNENEDLCAYSRPGHFRGVLTVVNHLLWIVQPDIMILGEKD